MRATSSSSSTSRVSWRTWRSMTSRGPGRASARPARCGGSPRARCGSARAGCAARATAWRGTRPCAGSPPAAAPRPARRSCDLDLQAAVQARVLERDRGALGQLVEHAVAGRRRPRVDQQRAEHAVAVHSGSTCRAADRAGTDARAGRAAPARGDRPARSAAASPCSARGSAGGRCRRAVAAGASAPTAQRRHRRARRTSATGASTDERRHQHSSSRRMRRRRGRASRSARGSRATRKCERRVVLLGDAPRRLGRGERDALVGLAAQAPLHQVQVDEHLDLACAASRARPATGCSRPRRASSRAPSASRRRTTVMKMIGVCAERLYWRISAAVSKPSMSGMLTSSRMTANSRSQHLAQRLARPSARRPGSGRGPRARSRRRAASPAGRRRSGC